jgi:hypothetical protein
MTGRMKAALGHPKCQHFVLLLKYFVLSVALVFADVVTDIITASEFFALGHKYWGFFTIVPIFAPFVVKAVITISNLVRCFKLEKYCLELNKTRFAVWINNDVWQLLWHFPLLQPIRYYILVIKKQHLNFAF